MPNQYSIRELAKEFGVTTRTLRFYEEKGLLAPLRDGQNRIYSASDRARLILVLRGKTLGLSLEQSADLISMYDPSSNNKKQLELLIDKISTRRAQLEEQKLQLEQMIVDLDDWEARTRSAMSNKLKLNKVKVNKVSMNKLKAAKVSRVKAKNGAASKVSKAAIHSTKNSTKDSANGER